MQASSSTWVSASGSEVAQFAASGLPAVSTAAVVFAALLASVFAPLVDQAVILTGAALRRRRAGG